MAENNLKKVLISGLGTSENRAGFHVTHSSLVLWRASSSCNDPVLLQAGASAIWQPISGRYFPRGCGQADPSHVRREPLTQRVVCSCGSQQENTRIQSRVSPKGVGWNSLSPSLHRTGLEAFLDLSSGGPILLWTEWNLKDPVRSIWPNLHFFYIGKGLTYCP